MRPAGDERVSWSSHLAELGPRSPPEEADAAAATAGARCSYGLGYLALRFQLTALGVGTDLSILDERYLFEGAKFLLVVVTAIPVGVLIGLPVAALLWPAGRALPGARDALVRWWSAPARPLIAGIVFAVLLIQVVMRQCSVQRSPAGGPAPATARLVPRHPARRR